MCDGLSERSADVQRRRASDGISIVVTTSTSGDCFVTWSKEERAVLYGSDMGDLICMRSGSKFTRLLCWLVKAIHLRLHGHGSLTKQLGCDSVTAIDLKLPCAAKIPWRVPLHKRKSKK